MMMRKRAYSTLILALLFFTLLIVRLAYVQLVQGDELGDKAEQSWRREVPYRAKRGEIVDRNGDRLAYNVSSPSVLIVPAQVRHPEQTATKLAKVLGTSQQKLLTLLTKRQMIVNVQSGGRQISLEKAQQVKKLHLPGIIVAEDNKRYYPYQTLASHLLGIVGYDGGLTGVEAKYDQRLQGLNGNVSFLSDAAGRIMPGSTDVYSKPQDGLNLMLTVDRNVQTIMERELNQAVLKFQPDHIIAIAMNPNNGEILGMASRPTFQPDQFRTVDPAIYNRNLPIWMTYEPGSTFKIITIAAALQEGLVDLKEEHFFDKGAVEVGGARLRCWKRGGHGDQTFMEVVQNSCNPGFVALGNRLGAEKLFSYIRAFGFGQKTGIDLGGEENGILFKPSQVGPVELATTAFGQGVSVTPIQQITAVSAAINGGKLYQPHVAKALIKPETGEVVQQFSPKLVRQVISSETSAKVREALESVVALGTGRNAYIDGFRVGGKTGTAQKVIDGRYSANEHIVSFVGFAPADHPQVVVYVAVDNPRGIQFGGLVAAPIVQQMLTDMLPYLNVQPNKTQIERQYRYGDIVQPYVAVPNLIGKTVGELQEDLSSDFNLSSVGKGNVVKQQTPIAGTRIERGSTIRILLGE